MSAICCQPSVLAPLSNFGRSLGFRLKSEVDPQAGLRCLQNAFDPSWGAVGLGEPLVRALGSTVPGLRTFPALSGPGCFVPSLQHALWINLAGEDRSTVFDHAEAITSQLEKFFELEDAVDTFKYQGGRDLTGYEDGTENPGPEESVNVALLQVETAGLAASSFVAVQRWKHDLRGFNAHSPKERDDMIGRHRETNEELDNAPESAHVKRSAQESFAPEAFLVRRSMPWTNGNDQGLEFVAYSHSLDAFEQILRRMLGLEDGIVDALFRFSTPITGAYYWCPPVAAGKLDLSFVSPQHG